MSVITEFLSSTLTEDQYLKQRAARSADTASACKSALTNVKLFCTDAVDTDFYLIMAELKRDSEETRNVEKTLVFLQKFVTWLHDEHPHLMMPANQNKDLKPYQKKSVASIRNYIGQLRKYLKRVGGIPVSAEDVSDFMEYPEEGEMEEAEALTHDELRTIIDNQKSFRRKMLYKITKDTCSRIRAMCGLRRENVNLDVRPIEITFPKHIMKGKRRTVVKYVTQENEDDFIKFLKAYPNPRDLLFGTNENGKIAATTEQKIWNKFVKKLGFTQTYSHNNRLKKNIHSIKAFAETAAEEAVDAFYANAYGDHDNYLSQYIRWSYEKKIKKFRAMEPLLNLYTKIIKVSDSPELLKQNEALNKKVSLQDGIIAQLADEIKAKNGQVPKDTIKEMIETILKEKKLKL